MRHSGFGLSTLVGLSSALATVAAHQGCGGQEIARRNLGMEVGASGYQNIQRRYVGNGTTGEPYPPSSYIPSHLLFQTQMQSARTTPINRSSMPNRSSRLSGTSRASYRAIRKLRRSSTKSTHRSMRLFRTSRSRARPMATFVSAIVARSQRY